MSGDNMFRLDTEFWKAIEGERLTPSEPPPGVKFPLLGASVPLQGEYPCGAIPGEGKGDPRSGVRGAMIPSSFRLRPPPILGKSDSRGANIDLTSEVRGTVYPKERDLPECPSVGVPRSKCAGIEDGVPGIVSTTHQDRDEFSLIETQLADNDHTSRLTLRRQDIVIGAQAQKEEQRDHPHANRKERCDIHKTRCIHRTRLGSVSIPRLSFRLGLLSLFREIKEPKEMIRDDHGAGQEESRRCEGDEWPLGGKVGQVDAVSS